MVPSYLIPGTKGVWRIEPTKLVRTIAWSVFGSLAKAGDTERRWLTSDSVLRRTAGVESSWVESECAARG